jgi:hypothetical protein
MVKKLIVGYLGFTSKISEEYKEMVGLQKDLYDLDSIAYAQPPPWKKDHSPHS